MASLKRIEHKNGRIVYRIVICMGYDNRGNKLVKNITYSVNQTSTPKQQEKEALKYAMDMEDKLKYGYDFDAEKMSFEEFTVKWLESIKNEVAYGTYLCYRHSLDNSILPYFKGFKLAHIKTANIEAFYKTFVNDYSIGTIKKHATVLSSIFTTAKRWNMIENHPCKGARIPKKTVEEQGVKYFTPEQALMFMKSLNIEYEIPHDEYKISKETDESQFWYEYVRKYTLPTQCKVFFALSLFCGFRRGETLGLKWSDIDFDKREISISKSVGRTENGVDYKTTKTATSIRTVPFPEKLTPLLKQYFQEYTLLRFSIGSEWKGDGNLFVQRDGKRMSIGSPYQHFIKHLNRYNNWVEINEKQANKEGLEKLPIIPLHGLRHSCATLLNYLNVNIVDISKYLGHANCTTTMNIYAHSFEEQKREASNKLDDFLEKNA